MDRTGPIVLSALLLAGGGGGALAQHPKPVPRLVRDIRLEAEPSLTPFPWLWEFVEIGGVTLFRGWDDRGWELWATDGTAEGTHLVKDICPGQCSSTPWELRKILGAVYFTASDPDHGREIWRTDGTTEGTELALDVLPGSRGSDPWVLTELDGQLFFQADDSVHGHELWRSDGTPSGTEMVADIQGGSIGSWPLSLFPVGDTLYFSADDGISGRELWKSDGTSAGTVQVADLCPGGGNSLWFDTPVPSGSRTFQQVDGRLIIALSPTAGCEDGIWTSDGTPEGTLPLPQIESGVAFPVRLADGAVLLSASDEGPGSSVELWRTDGTPEGTLQLTDSGSLYGTQPRLIGAKGGEVFFSGWDPEHGTELWKTDGTAVGTGLVADIRPGTEAGLFGDLLPQAAVLGDEVFFVADDGEHGYEVWATDGTEVGTHLAADLNEGGDDAFIPIYHFVFPGVVGGRVVTMPITNDHGFSLWATDGTPAGTEMLRDLDAQASSTPLYGFLESALGWLAPMAATEHGVVWKADDGLAGRELWISNGTEGGTRLLADLCSPPCTEDSFHGIPRSPVQVGDLAFVHQHLGDGPLWVTDGTPAGTHRLLEGLESTIETIAAWPRPDGLPRALVATSSAGVWASDGSEGGTVSLVDEGRAVDLAPAGERAFFTIREDPSWVLWVTDGTPGGTQDVLAFEDAEAEQGVAIASLGDGRVVFGGMGPGTGREPWVSDGSAAGSGLLLDIRPGPESSLDTELLGHPMGAGRRVYFAADDGISGRELWVTNGTPAGTRSLGDLNPGPAGSDPRPLASDDRLLYFSAFDLTHGRELWRTDGSPTGTRRVADLNPGGPSSISDALFIYSYARPAPAPAVWNDRLYFAATDGTTGLELWSTDGTERGTSQVADINPGPGSSSPNGFAVYADQLFFTATDGIHGFELWAIGDPLPPDVLFGDGFESGDTSAWGQVVP